MGKDHEERGNREAVGNGCGDGGEGVALSPLGKGDGAAGEGRWGRWERAMGSPGMGDWGPPLRTGAWAQWGRAIGRLAWG